MSLHFHLDRHRTPIPAFVAVALLVLAVATPAWSSPADPSATTATRPLPGPPTAADVNAATGAVRRPGHATSHQDLRSPDPRDATVRPAIAREQDLRHLRAGGAAARPPLPGPPTWPAHVEPISAGPATAVTPGPDGINRTTIGLGIAGSLLALGGIAALSGRRSRRLRTTP